MIYKAMGSYNYKNVGNILLLKILLKYFQTRNLKIVIQLVARLSYTTWNKSPHDEECGVGELFTQHMDALLFGESVLG